MACRLEVHCGHTNVGQVLAAVGASPELGCWDLGKAVKLETRAEIFPIWKGTLQPDFFGTEFKFVILESAGNATWETLPNRCWEQDKLGSAVSKCVLRTSFDRSEIEVKELAELQLEEQQQQQQQTSGVGYVDTPGPTCSSQGDDHACKIRFKATVSVSEVPHYGDSDLQDCLWYNDGDYRVFLQLRLALSKEYKNAVRQHRTHKSGSFDILDPLLSNESTRGFDFHRITLRLNHTHAYIKAVLDEQARQLQNTNSRSGFVLDDVELSKTALRVSESDVLYSIERAQQDYLAVCETCPIAGKSEHMPEKEGALQPQQPEQEAASLHKPTMEMSHEMLRVPSIPLMDHSEEDGEYRHPSGPSPKGFGLPRDLLQEHGLRATGRKDAAVQ